METKVLTEIQEYSLQQYEENNNVRVHITKVDYPNNHRYNTVCGVWVNGELTETYELEDINNNEIDAFIKETDELVRSKTLFLI